MNTQDDRLRAELAIARLKDERRGLSLEINRIESGPSMNDLVGWIVHVVVGVAMLWLGNTGVKVVGGVLLGFVVILPILAKSGRKRKALELRSNISSIEQKMAKEKLIADS